MADLKYLHNETLKLRQRAHEKLDEAYSSTVKALRYNRAADFQRASGESELANHYLQEAMQFEQEAIDIDHHIAELEIKAIEIDRQATDMQLAVRSKLEILDRLRRTIVGNF